MITTYEEACKVLGIGKDYVNVHDNFIIVIDRKSDYENRGFDGEEYKVNLSCSNHSNWREATEQEVVQAFENHLVYRFGKDWKTMKIKDRHPSLVFGYPRHDGLWNVVISKGYGGWSVWNENGLLYYDGIWVERLEELKIHIKEAIKERTVIHCETEEEADRILGMAHVCGYKWVNGRSYRGVYQWEINESETCYHLLDGRFSDYDYFKKAGFTIIPSTQIADFEEKKTTNWTPAPEDIEEIEKLPIDKVTTRNLDIALRSKSLAPHRCPVCNGSGLVPNGFYMQTGGHWSTTSITPETCRSCGGTGIVWG